MFKIAFQEIIKVMTQFSEFKIKISAIHNIDLLLRKKNHQTVTSDYPYLLQKELMQLCFSNLSQWWMLIVFIALSLNPWRYQMSWTHLLNLQIEHPVLLGFWGISLISTTFIGIFIFILNYLMNKSQIILFIFGLLVAQSDMHFQVAIAFVGIVMFSDNLRLSFQIYKKYLSVFTIVKNLLVLRMATWLLSTYLIHLCILQFKMMGLFQQNMSFLRFECYILSVFMYWGLDFLISSVWGHFYIHSLKKAD